MGGGGRNVCQCKKILQVRTIRIYLGDSIHLNLVTTVGHIIRVSKKNTARFNTSFSMTPEPFIRRLRLSDRSILSQSMQPHCDGLKLCE